MWPQHRWGVDWLPTPQSLLKLPFGCAEPPVYCAPRASHGPSQARSITAPTPVGHKPRHHQLFRLPVTGQDQPPLLPARSSLPQKSGRTMEHRLHSKCGAGAAQASLAAADNWPRTPGRSRGFKLQLTGNRAPPAIFIVIAQQLSGGASLPDRGHSVQLWEAAADTTNGPPNGAGLWHRLHATEVAHWAPSQMCSKPGPQHRLNRLSSRQGASEDKMCAGPAGLIVADD
ncbi:hypothetical protein NDU88_003052 [Pleurodeles waltl]|uniref:Uncharacterized protein n=1 Tax=Pleurodeles waltl TaxID=8319 RepID=A0AAV7KX37_PLEWA|nr:hypothetical protein NDU88_003052 [Pleurodeles waltl]